MFNKMINKEYEVIMINSIIVTIWDTNNENKIKRLNSFNTYRNNLELLPIEIKKFLITNTKDDIIYTLKIKGIDYKINNIDVLDLRVNMEY